PGLTEIKTKAFVAILGAFELDNVLVVSPERDEILEKSARNVPHTKVLCSEGLNVYDVLKYRHLVLAKNAVPKIEAALGRTATEAQAKGAG
ncbi:MAG: 50S ribosomal protein L4, partial [Syntrophobacteria bacterium]